MPRVQPKHVAYSTGTVNPAPSGSWNAYVRVDGVRHRARKDTLEEAKAWITMTEEAHDANRPPLSKLQAADAVRALTLLPEGYTLTDAARALSATVLPPQGPSLPLDEAVDLFLEARRPFVVAKTLAGYENTCKRFARLAGGDLRDSSAAAVKTFIAGMGAETRNSKLRHLSAFFNWCIEEGMLTASPLAKVKKAPRQDAEIHVFTVDQAERLLRTAAAVQPKLVPYFALALFAGVRPEELQRMPAAKIGQDWILIDGEVSKKRRRRTIPIQPNLRAWLDVFPPPGPGIYWYRRAFRSLVLTADLAWHNDVCRHTFGSMRWEVIQDPLRVAAEMGNSPDVLMSAYRALVGPGDGAKFFSIWPACPLVRPIIVQQKSQPTHLQAGRSPS